MTRFIYPLLYFGIKNGSMHQYQKDGFNARISQPHTSNIISQPHTSNMETIRRICKTKGTTRKVLITPKKKLDLTKCSIVDFPRKGKLHTYESYGNTTLARNCKSAPMTIKDTASI